MERRDYLLHQIQMMGMFLQKLIARLLKRKEDGDTDGMLEMVKNEFQNELKIDIDELVILEDEGFFSILNEKHFTESHLENLAQILLILGKPDDIEISLTSRNHLQKAQAIYLKLENESRNFSVERNEKIAQIHQLLNGF